MSFLLPERFFSQVDVRRRIPLALVIFLAAGLIGCGAIDDPPPEETGVHSFEVDFILDELEFNGTVAATTYDAPEFTLSVVRDGAVLAYFRDLEDTWSPLPFTYGVESDEQPAVDYTATLSFAFERNRLDVFVEASSTDPAVHDAIRDAQLFQGALPIKVVVIPGGQMMHSTVDYSNFESVKKHHNLQD